MPIRIGFAEHRSRLLQQELTRILKLIPQLGITKAILVGPIAGNFVGSSSDIELIIVHDVDTPFSRRPDFFFSHLEPRIGLQVYVYTPKEFEELNSYTNTISRTSLAGVQIYNESN